jgi:hypothetical protein
MPKTTTIDHTSVLEMALVGYEIHRNRIEAVIAEIQAELGRGGPSRSISPATASASPKPTRKKRFSSAARKRMATARRRRRSLRLLQSARRLLLRPLPGNDPSKVKAAKKATLKSTARKAAPRIKKAVAKPKAQASVPPVQAAVEPAPTEATV